ncbi:MAG: NOB1 family endonuclease [Promethearchaeota archaeon]
MEETTPQDSEILILDAGGLIAGLDINSMDFSCYTTNDILSEVKNQHVQNKLMSYILTQKLKILDPLPEDIKKIEEVSKISGDYGALSANDIGVLALALTINGIYNNNQKEINAQNKGKDKSAKVRIKLVSDDYSVLNVIKFLGIESISGASYKTFGIKKAIRWETYCPHCYKKYPPEYLGHECDVCGAIIKRRPISHQKGRRKKEVEKRTKK